MPVYSSVAFILSVISLSSLTSLSNSDILLLNLISLSLEMLFWEALKVGSSVRLGSQLRS